VDRGGANYLRLAVWPRGLVLDYSDWPRVTTLASGLPAAGLLAALLAGAVWGIRRRWWWGSGARGSSSCWRRRPVSCFANGARHPSGECTCLWCGGGRRAGRRKSSRPKISGSIRLA